MSSYGMMKFKSKKIKVDGMVFDSKKEYQRYLELVELEKNGDIENLQRQVKFVLLPKQEGERAITYIADHVYKYGEVLVIEDVKSKITKKQSDYIIKRKLLKYFYISRVTTEFEELCRLYNVKKIYFKEYV